MRLNMDAKREEDDALLREANEVLAQTETVLKHRKDALLAKHIEGRESLHELDYIFENKRQEDSGSNWLDTYAREQEEESKVAVNLNIESSSARTNGVVEAVRAREIERRESPKSEEYPNSDEEIQRIEDLKVERQRMLDLIKNNKKASMQEIESKSEPKYSGLRTDGQILTGLGSGILQDLEDDLPPARKPVEDDSNASDPNKI